MTPSALEAERLRAVLAAAGAEARPSPECPTPEEIWGAARAELEPERARDVVDHLATCAACAEAWELAGDLAGGAETVGLARESPARRPASRRWLRHGAPWLAAAAALILAAAVPLLLRSPDSPRGDARELTSSIAPEAMLPRDGCVLRWSGPEGAESYLLRVSWTTAEEAGLLIEAAEIAATRDRDAHYRIPASDLREVPPGARLLWQVTARGEREVLARKTFTARLE